MYCVIFFPIPSISSTEIPLCGHRFKSIDAIKENSLRVLKAIPEIDYMKGATRIEKNVGINVLLCTLRVRARGVCVCVCARVHTRICAHGRGLF